MEKAGSRLMLTINELGISRGELKEKMVVSQGTVVNILKRDRLTAGQIAKLFFLERDYGVNLKWLESGEPYQMFLKSPRKGFHLTDDSRLTAAEGIEKQVESMTKEIKELYSEKNKLYMELSKARKENADFAKENNKLVKENYELKIENDKLKKG